MSESTLTEGERQPFIAVIGDPLKAKDHYIIIENNILLKNMASFEDAVTMFFGLIYCLNLEYNSKNTFEFLQRGLLRIDEGSKSKRVTTLLGKLYMNS